VGAALTSFFVWLDRGMYVPGSAGWGILLFAAWTIWSAGTFFLARGKAVSLLPTWVWPLGVGCVVTLLLINNRVMYAEIASANSALLARGPIQILPKNLSLYLSALLWSCLGLLLAYVFIMHSSRGRSRLALVLLGIAATTHLLVFRQVPFPLIDVFTTVTEASVALLEGRNPYQISYTDIYQGQGITPSGFGYLPGLFPWSIAGMVLAGDIRAGNFLALIGMTLLFTATSKAHGIKESGLLACTLFLGGAGLFVAEQAWIDPILAFLILASLWLLMKGRITLAGILAGFLCATKQYGVVAFGFLVVMAWNRESGTAAIKFFLLALLTGVLIQAPFVIWDPNAYWNTVFVGVSNLPLRPDAYTLVSWISARGLSAAGIPILGVVVFLALILRCRTARFTDGGIVLSAIATAYMAIFLTNRHAFCNYYQLVFLLLLGSLYFNELDPVSDPEKIHQAPHSRG
jgi:hypothetical protein